MRKLTHTLAAIAIAVAMAGTSPAAGFDQVVAEIQTLLDELGYSPGPIDGVLGGGTRRALILFGAVENLQLESENAEQRRAALEAIRVAHDTRSRPAGPELYLPTSGGSSDAVLAMDDSGETFVAIQDGIARVWDTSTGDQVRTLTLSPLFFDPEYGELGIGLTSDGRHLIAGRHAVQVVDLRTGITTRAFSRGVSESESAAISEIELRPGTTELYAIEGRYVTTYNWASGEFLRRLARYESATWSEGGNRYEFKADYITATSIAISNDGRYLASAGTEWGIRLYDLDSGRIVFTAKGMPAVAYDNLRFSRDGRFVYATAHSYYSRSPDHFIGGERRLQVFRLDVETREISALDLMYSDLLSGQNFYTVRDLIRVRGHTSKSRADEWYEIGADGEPLRIAGKVPDIVSASGKVSVIYGAAATFLVDGTERKSATPRRPKSDSMTVPWSIDWATGRPVDLEFLGRAEEMIGAIHRSRDQAIHVVLGGPPVGSETDLAASTTGDLRLYGSDTGEILCTSSERATWALRDLPDDLTLAMEVANDKSPVRRETASWDWSSVSNLGVIWQDGAAAVVDETCATLRHIPMEKATDYRWRVSKIFQDLYPVAKPTYSEGVRFSSDGRSVLAWRPEQAVQRFDVETGALLGTYSTRLSGNTAVSAEDASYLRNNPEHLNVEDVLSIPGRPAFLVNANGGIQVGDINGLMVIQYFEENRPEMLNAYVVRNFDHWAVSPDGRYLALGNSLGVRILDPRSGTLISGPRPESPLTALTFSEDGSRLLVRSQDSFLRVFDTRTGSLLARTMLFADGEWVSITPAGFFAASPEGAEGLFIRMSGLEVVPLGAAYDALYRPDLVREAFAGDPAGKVASAAALLDLETVIASGGAPRVEIPSPLTGLDVDADTVEVTARITDRGGGIGRVEWRVNGVTLGINGRGFDRLAQASEAAAPVTAETREVVQRLSLDPGLNLVEVVAYNGRDLIASDPVSIEINWTGASSTMPPKLFVLSVGINDYWDSRLQLNYAASDARAVAAAFEIAGRGLYETVETTVLLDSDVSAAGLDAAFESLSQKVRPRDVFVLFMAGHGKTQQGRYYFLPQDFRYQSDDSVAEHGIDQEQFQEWLARIPARKSVLLYDTCDSGSLTNAATSRGLEEVAALERMTRAMGRTVLSASTDDAPALEGFNGHGVFTYALLQALGEGDANGDGTIEVTELASSIDKAVPEISYATFNFRQIPQMSIVGSDFPVANTAQVITAATTPDQPAPPEIPAKPTHVVIVAADVYAREDQSSEIVASLLPGSQVTLIERLEDFALVARNGRVLGFVKLVQLATLQ